MTRVKIAPIANNGQLGDNKIKVLWVHNTEDIKGMFLGDMASEIPSEVDVREIIVPLRPRVGAMLYWIRQVREAANTGDLVHAQFGSLVGALASFTRKPLILSLRGTDFYVLPSRGWRARFESRLRQLFSYLACMRATVIVVMSERMRRELRQWPFLSGKTIVVITDPVGREFLEHEGSEQPNPDIREGAPLRVFVGSLSALNPVKRTWIVKEAVELCRAIGIAVDIRVVSGIPRTSVKDVMKESDMVALVSTHEGWPNIIKEGQALGLPFIATDVSDLAMFCGPGTQNRIVEPNPSSVALAIIDAAARKRFSSAQAEIIPAIVGLKHHMLYHYVSRA